MMKVVSLAEPRRRTCMIEGQLLYDSDMGYAEPHWETELSCGDTVLGFEPVEVGMFCPYCGAEVVG